MNVSIQGIILERETDICDILVTPGKLLSPLILLILLLKLLSNRNEAPSS